VEVVARLHEEDEVGLYRSKLVAWCLAWVFMIPAMRPGSTR
jgi:hypothetical protein